ncbi:MAG: hypothetical protein U0P30_00935 [Vicinamibacterales bacterium]
MIPARLPGRRVAAPLVAIAALAVLALCTTAWTTFDRGLFQDDAQVLWDVRHQPTFLAQVWQPIASATRRLQGTPYAIALRMPDTLDGILLLTELLPFGVALVAMAITRVAALVTWPWAFLAGALTITATSDWLTASPVALGYQMAVLLFVSGVLGLLRWARFGGRLAFAAALVCGTASLWTIDAATTVYPIVPLLGYLAADDDAGRRRATRLAWTWWLVAVPYYVLFVAFLLDTDSYAATAVLDRPWWHRLARLALLVLHNVTPWRWAWARGEWFGPMPWPPLGHTIVAVATGLATTAVVFRWLRGQPAGSHDDDPWRGMTMASVFATCTVLANATYMSVHLAFLYYRTHVHARVWWSMALALGLAWLARQGVRQARVAVAIAVLFLGTGIAGGVERQVFFRDAWTRHRVELASLAEALPPAPAHLVLTRHADPGAYVATQVPYLARFWAGLLGSDLWDMCRVSLVAPLKETTCHAEADRLVCEVAVNRTNARCGPTAGRAEIPYDRLVVADYDAATNRYEVVSTLPEAFTPAGDAADRARAAYAPHALAPGAVREPFARRLLRLDATPAAPR